MSDLETLLAPLLDSAPDPAPLAAVTARAARIRRRRRIRSAVVAVVIVGAVAGGIAALPRERNGVSTVGPPPTRTVLTVDTPLAVHESAADMISAVGSIWVSQPERVTRLDPVTGRVIARIRVPGSSDSRNLAFGAGSIWVDDTATEVVTRIDPGTNRVRARIPLPDPVLVTDGIAFADGKLWVARPMPNDDAQAEVVTIDPATDRVVHVTTISRAFKVVASSDALWYVMASVHSLSRDLVRFDLRTRHEQVVRHDVTAVLAVSGDRLWVEIIQGVQARGVVEIDRTGAQIGRDIPLGAAVNTTAAVGDGVLWLAWQPDSSNPGTLTPYDAVSRRALAKPVRVGLPISNVVLTRGAVWVAAYTPDGLARVPFSRT